MKSLRTYSLLLAASAALFLTAACSTAPDAEKDPSADAAYKREHRTPKATARPSAATSITNQ